MVIAHIHERSYPGVTIEISDESQLLLDTGGALRKAQWFLDGEESFLVHNVDVISAIDLHDMMRCHLEYKPLATLAVSERKSSRYFLWDSDQVLRGWENSATGESLPATGIPSDSKRLAFSGIHIIDPVIFSHINQSGRFSIIPEYIRLSGLHPIQGYLHDASSWFDLGKVENIEGATEFLKNNA
jgi:NDP-sugar pyrophosphorylase family protein